MLRIGQRVLTGNVEFVKFNVVQEHIDAAQVVRCDVDFLSKEAVAHGIPSQHLFCLQQQRTGTAGRVIYLVDFLFAYRTKPIRTVVKAASSKSSKKVIVDILQYLPTVPSRVSSSETSAGVKNSPPDLPALLAYMVIRYS